MADITYMGNGRSAHAPNTVAKDQAWADSYLKKHPGAAGFGDSEAMSGEPDSDYDAAESKDLFKKGMQIVPSDTLPNDDDD
jgi:hypothetical protein